jgi:hypothetical protein
VALRARVQRGAGGRRGGAVLHRHHARDDQLLGRLLGGQPGRGAGAELGGWGAGAGGAAGAVGGDLEAGRG